MFGRKAREERQRDGAEVFHGLRRQALTLAPASVGLSPTAELPRVFGFVMDISFDNGTATVVAIADRTTSLYTSTGGGVIGAGTHDNVASAAHELLLAAEAHLDVFVDVDVDPGTVPRPGDVRLTALTYDGRRSLDAPDDDLGERRHAATPVFYAAHAVITELRRIDDRASAPSETGDTTAEGVTRIMAAAHSGDLAAVGEMIDEGVDVDAQDDEGYTALMYAANAGHEDIVRLLVARGADPNAADRQMSTPLMFAAQYDHLPIVRHLLEAGADPTARGDHGLTALGFAQQNGHARTAAILLSAGGV